MSSDKHYSSRWEYAATRREDINLILRLSETDKAALHKKQEDFRARLQINALLFSWLVFIKVWDTKTFPTDEVHMRI